MLLLINTSLQAKARIIITMKIQHDVSLADYTSFGTGGPAEIFITISKRSEITDALLNSTHPIWFLGAGANVLISDKGLPGTTLHMQSSQLDISKGTGLCIITADAGVDWDDLVKASIKEKKWGLERMSGIPGTVGAAVVGNIAAYGQAVSHSLLWVEVIDTKSSDIVVQRIPAEQLGFDYRFSDFQTDRFKDFVIISAAFALSDNPEDLVYASALNVAKELKLDPNKLGDRRKIILESRKRAGSLLGGKDDPKTAGSFFRNPIVSAKLAEEIMKYEEHSVSTKEIKTQNKVHGGSTTRVSAAHVMLAAGFKRGQSWGPVRLHPEHVLKIENTGGATSQQIYEVVQEIIKTVKDKLGIELVPEVRILGDFS